MSIAALYVVEIDTNVPKISYWMWNSCCFPFLETLSSTEVSSKFLIGNLLMVSWEAFGKTITFD